MMMMQQQQQQQPDPVEAAPTDQEQIDASGGGGGGGQLPPVAAAVPKSDFERLVEVPLQIRPSDVVVGVAADMDDERIVENARAVIEAGNTVFNLSNTITDTTLKVIEEQFYGQAIKPSEIYTGVMKTSLMKESRDSVQIKMREVQDLLSKVAERRDGTLGPDLKSYLFEATRKATNSVVGLVDSIGMLNDQLKVTQTPGGQNVMSQLMTNINIQNAIPEFRKVFYYDKLLNRAMSQSYTDYIANKQNMGINPSYNYNETKYVTDASQLMKSVARVPNGQRFNADQIYNYYVGGLNKSNAKFYDGSFTRQSLPPQQITDKIDMYARNIAKQQPLMVTLTQELQEGEAYDIYQDHMIFSMDLADIYRRQFQYQLTSQMRSVYGIPGVPEFDSQTLLGVEEEGVILPRKISNALDKAISVASMKDPSLDTLVTGGYVSGQIFNDIADHFLAILDKPKLKLVYQLLAGRAQQQMTPDFYEGASQTKGEVPAAFQSLFTRNLLATQNGQIQFIQLADAVGKLLEARVLPGLSPAYSVQAGKALQEFATDLVGKYGGREFFEKDVEQWQYELLQQIESLESTSIQQQSLTSFSFPVKGVGTSLVDQMTASRVLSDFLHQMKVDPQVIDRKRRVLADKDLDAIIRSQNYLRSTAADDFLGEVQLLTARQAGADEVMDGVASLTDQVKNTGELLERFDKAQATYESQLQSQFLDNAQDRVRNIGSSLDYQIVMASGSAEEKQGFRRGIEVKKQLLKRLVLNLDMQDKTVQDLFNTDKEMQYALTNSEELERDIKKYTIAAQTASDNLQREKTNSRTLKAELAQKQTVAKELQSQLALLQDKANSRFVDNTEADRRLQEVMQNLNALGPDLAGGSALQSNLLQYSQGAINFNTLQQAINLFSKEQAMDLKNREEQLTFLKQQQKQLGDQLLTSKFNMNNLENLRLGVDRQFTLAGLNDYASVEYLKKFPNSTTEQVLANYRAGILQLKLTDTETVKERSDLNSSLKALRTADAELGQSKKALNSLLADTLEEVLQMPAIIELDPRGQNQRMTLNNALAQIKNGQPRSIREVTEAQRELQKLKEMVVIDSGETKGLVSKINTYGSQFESLREKYAIQETKLKEVKQNVIRVNQKLAEKGIIPNQKFTQLADVTDEALQTFSTSLEEISSVNSEALNKMRSELTYLKQDESRLKTEGDQLASMKEKTKAQYMKVTRMLGDFAYTNKTTRPLKSIDDMEEEIKKMRAEGVKVDAENDQVLMEMQALVQEQRQLREKKAELARSREQIKMSKINEQKVLLDTVLYENAIKRMEQKAEGLKISVQASRTGDLAQLRTYFNMNTQEVEMFTGAPERIDEYIRTNETSIPENKVLFFRELVSNTPMKDMATRALTELVKLQFTGNPALKDMAESVKTAGQNILAKFVADSSMYFLNPSDDPATRERVDGELESQLKTYHSALLQVVNTARKVIAVDDELEQIKLFGGAEGTRTVKDLLDTKTQNSIMGSLNDITTTAQAIRTSSLGSNISASGVISGIQSINTKFNQIQKEIGSVKNKSILLSTRGQIQKGVDAALSGIMDEDFMASASNTQDMTKMLSNVLRELAEHTMVTYVMNVGEQDAANEQMMREKEQKFKQILMENGHLTEADAQTKTKNLQLFVRGLQNTFKEDFVRELAKVTSDQFSDVYRNVERDKISSFLSSQIQAKSYIQQKLLPPVSLSESQSELQQFFKNDLRGVIDTIEELKNDTRGRLRSIVEARPVEAPGVDKSLQRLRTAVGGRVQERGLAFFGTPVDQADRAVNERTGSINQEMQIISQTMKQKEIYNTDKTMLPQQKKEAMQQKNEFEKMYTMYNIDTTDSESTRQLASATRNMITFLAQNVLTDQQTNRSYKTLKFSANGPDPIGEIVQNSATDQIEFAYDLAQKLPEVISVITGPLKFQMQQGIRPIREQILNVVSLRNLINLVKTTGEIGNLPGLTPEAQKMTKEISSGRIFFGRDEEEYRQMKAQGKTGMDILNLAQDDLQTFAEEVAQYGQAYVKNNIAFLDSEIGMIDKRLRSETEIDKVEKLNEQVDKMGKSFEDHFFNKLQAVNLKSFFQGEPELQNQFRRVQQNMFPRGHNPAQNNGLMQNNPNEQPLKPPGGQFVAMKDSEAAKTGDPSADRLSTAAIQQARQLQKIKDEDVDFLAQVVLDEGKGKLTIKDAKNPTGRDLTKEEKRRYIRLLIILLVSLYASEVKKLSAADQKRAEKKLLTKYLTSEHTQPVIKMVNKLAAKAVKSGPGFVKNRADYSQQEKTSAAANEGQYQENSNQQVQQ